MSLLYPEQTAQFQALVDAAFRHENETSPDYYARISPYTRSIIYRDTRYNIDYINTAHLLREERILTDYAAWLYQLMASVLKDRFTPEQVADYTAGHFVCIRQALEELAAPEDKADLLQLTDKAIAAVREAAARPLPEVPQTPSAKYEERIRAYMDCLLHKDSRQAVLLIQQYLDSGIPLNDIYVEILAESMRRVGELWHTARITVDAEHYCTSITQMAMAQMYPVLFAQKRKGRTLLCACPGTELHEMGARMVADLFENDGWDTIYLGAAVPVDALLDAVRENKPDLVALSVTMPQHLLACRELAEAVRREFPQMKIAVGGKAFESTHAIWTQWPIDLYIPDAREFIYKADELFA